MMCKAGHCVEVRQAEAAPDDDFRGRLCFVLDVREHPRLPEDSGYSHRVELNGRKSAPGANDVIHRTEPFPKELRRERVARSRRLPPTA
jgi:hypothetical protein